MYIAIEKANLFYTNVISFDSTNESSAYVYFRSMLHYYDCICMFRCVETRVRQFIAQSLVNKQNQQQIRRHHMDDRYLFNRLVAN